MRPFLTCIFCPVHSCLSSCLNLLHRAIFRTCLKVRITLVFNPFHLSISPPHCRIRLAVFGEKDFSVFFNTLSASSGGMELDRQNSVSRLHSKMVNCRKKVETALSLQKTFGVCGTPQNDLHTHIIDDPRANDKMRNRACSKCYDNTCTCFVFDSAGVVVPSRLAFK